jgi:hypothetical protein
MENWLKLISKNNKNSNILSTKPKDKVYKSTEKAIIAVQINN